MSGKRQAVSELNHDNWNDEDDDKEDMGEFKKASNDVLAVRKKVQARRRGINSGEDGANKAINPFSGFGGFNSAAQPAANPSPFSFLSKVSSTSSSISAPKTNGEIKTNDKSEYLSKVKALNVAFLGWIKQHVDGDGVCDLSPVFKDYEKYMKEFEALKKAPTASEPKKDTVASTVTSTSSSFSFGKPPIVSQPTSPEKNPISVFGTKPITSTTTTESKGFSFGLAAPAGNSQPFSFGLQKTSTGIGGASVPLFGAVTSTPFSFSNTGQNTATTEASADKEEENEEPPKNDFVPVVEEDSLYSKRCKVFVKSGNDYSDRGVGTLFLKKVEDKVQLLVRADTNLGNILLNIVVVEGLPVSRMGKNNVMIVCVPTPDSKPPPVPVLVRVKTGEEADELMETINKQKK